MPSREASIAPPTQPGAPSSRRYHVHAPGIGYALVTVFLALGAVNSQNNLLFWALGLALGGLLASGVISGAALLGLRVEAEPLDAGEAGAPLEIRYRISNANRFIPIFALVIEELDAEDRAGPRSRRALRAAKRTGPAVFVPYVGAGRTVRARALLVPRARGPIRLGMIRAATTFPLGMARKSVAFRADRSTLAVPPRLVLARDVLEAAVGRARHEAAPGTRRGPGDEFVSLRDYAPGDPARTIAWRASARTGALMVRQFVEPRPARRLLALDWSGVPEDRRRVMRERVLAIAAAVVAHAAREGIPIGIEALSGTSSPEIGVPRAGDAHARRLLNALALVPDEEGEGGTPRVDARDRIVIHAGGAGGAHAIDARSLEAHLRAPVDRPIVRALLGLEARA